MYKVFFNDSKLIFTDKGNVIETLMFDYKRKVEHFDDVVLVLEEIEKQGLNKTFLLECEDFDDILKGFNVVRSAGGLVKNKNDEWLFIRRLGRWDLPKGRIEDGESSELAAIREVSEECGLHGHSIVRKLLTGYHIFRSPFYPHPHNWVWKEVDWFEMEYSGNEIPTPQQEEHITAAIWFKASNLDNISRSTYQNIRVLINKFLRN